MPTSEDNAPPISPAAARELNAGFAELAEQGRQVYRELCEDVIPARVGGHDMAARWLVLTHGNPGTALDLIDRAPIEAVAYAAHIGVEPRQLLQLLETLPQYGMRVTREQP